MDTTSIGKRLADWAREREPRWYATTQGKLVVVKLSRYHEAYKTPKARGVIGKFTKAARLRMLKNLATISWDDVGESLFVTLTYPDDCVHDDFQKRNRERYLFHRYIEKHLGRRVPMVWRVEWKERKSGEYKGEIVPHIHLLVFGCRFLCQGRLRQWWKTIIGYEGPLALDVQRVPAGEVVSHYVAKYCGKVEEAASSLDNASYLNSGRHYGYTRKSLIPVHEKKMVHLRCEALIHWLRVQAASVIKSYDLRTSESFTLLGDIAACAAEKIRASAIA